ncbi:cytochrome P450 [Saccharothrix sp. Mg75]|uniref:cytochrome P450 n=1 Tax=Saccharothrix sp. Mg75 TaxID=3445357 RepID=UPI003EED95F4
MDESALVLTRGYAWLPGARRAAPDGIAEARVLGQHAVGLCGPDAARFFYDEDHVRRETAIPGPVQSTLFGHDAVHTLDGGAHRRRKAFFLSVLPHDHASDLVGSVTSAWEQEAASWAPGRDVVLFDAAARVLTRGVCRWAGVPLADDEVDGVARDLTAMVDGFATPGPRHWRARRARDRREAWAAGLVRDARDGSRPARPGSALDQVARHRDEHGEPLPPRVAAVELLNVVRPAVAVCWFVMFTGHALHRWPEHRERLRAGDPDFTRAFAHEVRRFYPFAPFLGGRAVDDLTWRDHRIPKGSLVLLDVYGQNHDADLWGDPYTFRPQRFLDRSPGPFDLVPQGGGDPATGHRCPGEPASVGLLGALAGCLARLDHEVPGQDLTISLRRVPAKVRSGFVITPV